MHTPIETKIGQIGIFWSIWTLDCSLPLVHSNFGLLTRILLGNSYFCKCLGTELQGKTIQWNRTLSQPEGTDYAPPHPSTYRPGHFFYTYIYLYSFQLEIFGYNCLLGNCNIIKYSGSDYTHWAIIDVCFIWIPCSIMLLSYGVIWWYILSNDRKLKRVDSRKEIRKVITKRELQTAMTFFSVFLCYFVCVMPSTIINLTNQRILNDYPALNFALGCLYYLQFSINIFIYAAKSEQYKKAYIYFLKKVSR